MNMFPCQNLLSDMPDKTMTQVLRIKSKQKSGYTLAGFVAFKHNGINDTSLRIWGATSQNAIANLNTFLAKK